MTATVYPNHEKLANLGLNVWNQPKITSQTFFINSRQIANLIKRLPKRFDKRFKLPKFFIKIC
jgi:hypothetical protein